VLRLQNQPSNPTLPVVGPGFKCARAAHLHPIAPDLSLLTLFSIKDSGKVPVLLNFLM